MTNSKLIKITNNKNDLMRHFGDEEIVDLLLGEEIVGYENDDPRLMDALPPESLYVDATLPRRTFWLSSHLFEIVPGVDKGEPCHDSNSDHENFVDWNDEMMEFEKPSLEWTDAEKIYCSLRVVIGQSSVMYRVDPIIKKALDIATLMVKKERDAGKVYFSS